MLREGLLLCACAVVAADLPYNVDIWENNAALRIPESLQEDASLKVPELVQKYGYPVEEHNVTTSDGYILTMHRIPHGRDDNSDPSAKRPIVFIMHGILCSSADFVVSGPEKSLAYLLAEKGFDVWLGNARGTRYSRAHVSLDPDGYFNSYWKFSWDEIGNLDMPAMIDYMLDTTMQEKMHYIGHSQGTTTFFVMCSLQPEYNNKFISMHALAPTVYFKHHQNAFFRALASASAKVLVLLGPGELLPNSWIMRTLGNLQLCRDGTNEMICSNIVFLLFGYNGSQMNKTMIPVYQGHVPAGAATRQFAHFTQIMSSEEFRRYDHGLIGNMQSYGTPTPPLYDLSQVRAPVYLHYTLSDSLAHVKDVETLWNAIGNPVEKIIIPMSSFNHIDFLWGIDAKELVYDKIIDIMEKLSV